MRKKYSCLVNLCGQILIVKYKKFLTLTQKKTTKYNTTVETLPFLITNVMFIEQRIDFVLQIPTFATETFFKA